MTPTKDQQAMEYAVKLLHDNINNLLGMPYDEVCKLFARAYLAGYTVCERSQKAPI